MQNNRISVIFRLCVFASLCFSATTCRNDTSVHYFDYNETIAIRNEQELADVKAKLQDKPDDLPLNCALWNYYAALDMSDSLFVNARKTYLMTKAKGDSTLMAYAGAYMGQEFFHSQQLDSMLFYFKKIQNTAESRKLYFPLMAIYNNMAMYRIYGFLDYSGALDYLHRALDMIETSGNTKHLIAVLSNMASIYFDREDLTGMEYAQKAYNLATSSDNVYYRLMSSLILARYSILTKEPSKGIKYAEEALRIVNIYEKEYEYYRVFIYSVYAELLMECGMDNTASKYLMEALRIWNEEEYGSVYGIMAYCGYGKLLLKSGRYRDCIQTMQSAYTMTVSKNSKESLPNVVEILSEAYGGLGQSDSSLLYYKIYTTLKDSIYTVGKEREFNNLVMQYEKTKHEHDLYKKELELSRQKRNTLFAIFFSGIVIFIFAGLLYINNRKNLMYRKLVEKDLERMKLTGGMQSGIVTKSNFSEDIVSGDMQKMGSMTENTARELFGRIENLMTEDKLYRNTDLTLDLIADKLGSNRWYISRAVNEFTGKSFPSYINEYRINDAVMVLSNPEDNTPLKQLAIELGYKSISVFYKYFQQKTGVPPSKYRSEMHRIMTERPPNTEK